MKPQLIIRPEAETDLAEQFEWYEARRSGLGYDFLSEIRAVFQKLEENPFRHAQIYRQARRALVRRFPFKVFYLFEADKIEVLGVVHVRRAPEEWQRRVP